MAELVGWIFLRCCLQSLLVTGRRRRSSLDGSIHSSYACSVTLAKISRKIGSLLWLLLRSRVSCLSFWRDVLTSFLRAIRVHLIRVLWVDSVPSCLRLKLTLLMRWLSREALQVLYVYSPLLWVRMMMKDYSAISSQLLREKTTSTTVILMWCPSPSAPEQPIFNFELLN